MFTADILNGYADVVIHQFYENDQDCPLEIDFVMPISSEFTVNKIVIQFTLKDGSSQYLQTDVMEKEQAQIKYDDAVASGKTAVLSTLPSYQYRKAVHMRVSLGNFPPNSKANLRAFCG